MFIPSVEVAKFHLNMALKPLCVASFREALLSAAFRCFLSPLKPVHQTQKAHHPPHLWSSLFLFLYRNACPSVSTSHVVCPGSEHAGINHAQALKILPELHRNSSRPVFLLSLSTVQTNHNFYTATCKQQSTPSCFWHFCSLPSKERTKNKQQMQESGRRCREKAQCDKPGAGSDEPRADGRARCLWGKAAACPSCQQQPCSSLAGVISIPKTGMLCRFRKIPFSPVSFSLVPKRQLCRNKDLGLQLVTSWTQAKKIILLVKTKILTSVNRTALCKACTVIPVHQCFWDHSWNGVSSWWLDFKRETNP